MYIHDTVALQVLRKGRSGKADLNSWAARLSRLLRDGGVAAEFYWAPSKLNIADLPSRNMWDALQSELAGIRGSHDGPDLLVVPSVAKWHSPLSEWARQHPSSAGLDIPV